MAWGSSGAGWEKTCVRVSMSPGEARMCFGTTGGSHAGVGDATEVGEIRVVCSVCSFLFSAGGQRHAS